MKLTAPLVVAMSCAAFSSAARAQDVPPPVDERAAYDDGYDPTAWRQFETALSPFGEWHDDPRYGRVWSPSTDAVDADFAPYATCGSWALSQYGWTWASTYPWGWATFHYGRWVTLASRRWAWVPGTAWGPAWVAWRAGDGYAGWSPLPPTRAPAAPGDGDLSSWRFVAADQIGAARPAYLAPPAVASIFPQTRWFNPAAEMIRDQRVVHYNPGPVALADPSTRVAPLPLATLPHADIGPPGAPRRATQTNASPWVNGPSNGAAEVAPPQYRPRHGGGGYYAPRAGFAAVPAGYAASDYAPPGAPRSGYPAAPGGYGPPGGAAGGGGFVGASGGFGGVSNGAWGGGGSRRGR